LQHTASGDETITNKTTILKSRRRKFEFLDNTFLNYLSDWNDAIDKEIDGIPMKKTKEGRAKVKNLKKKIY
jgi:hypothetical protein